MMAAVSAGLGEVAESGADPLESSLELRGSEAALQSSKLASGGWLIMRPWLRGLCPEVCASYRPLLRSAYVECCQLDNQAESAPSLQVRCLKNFS